MNVKKLLNQLIKLFLVLNLVLFIMNGVNLSTEYLLSQERITYIYELLSREGIEIESELERDFSPKRTADLIYKGDGLSVRNEMIKNFFEDDLVSVKRSKSNSKQHPGDEVWHYTLGGETLSFDRYELRYENSDIENSKVPLSLKEAKHLCESLMSRIGMKIDRNQYIIESQKHHTYWQLNYYYKLEGLPVLDLYMTFKVQSEGISSATMYLGEIEITSQTGQVIYPVDLVLFGIEEELLKEGHKRISKVSMAYKKLEEEDSIWGQKIVPVYKIEIDGLEEPLFVNAYTNKILD